VDGNLEDAIDCFTRAGELLHAARQPRQAAAAVRERGTALLAAGRLSAATTALDDAANLAELAADWEGHGAALNAIGLTHLAAGRVDDAIEAFRGAVASHPRTVRPESYAMAKANLALAYERAGAARPARLAARQALAASRTPPPVAGQAAGVLQRLGDPPGDLPALLDEEPSERWAGLVREEVVRWVDAGPAERRREADAWLDGQLRNEGAGTALCEVWLGALLELPPKHMEVLIQATLEALGQRGADDRERFGVQASAAMARFHVPQWIRLKEIFNRVAAEIGVEGHYG
jgi:tetratricopeptide (TPR) repeat protein